MSVPSPTSKACLRGFKRDPAGCDGKDCPQEIYDLCTRLPSTPFDRFCKNCVLFELEECPQKDRVASAASYANYCHEFHAKGKKKGEVGYMPLLTGTRLLGIHPAIDFIGDEAYIGQTLPCEWEDGEQREALCFIVNKRELFAATKNNLKDRGLKLAFYPIATDPRWSINSIQEYTQGKECLTKPEMYAKVKAKFEFYIEFGDPLDYDFSTLWNIGTYFHRLFNSYPYHYIGGVKGTGKTKDLQVSACMAFNSIFSGNMSTASLYRLIQNARCSLFIDETEALSNPERKLEFRNILLSGYKRGELTYRIGKTAKERLVPESFEVYSPKMLANIGGLEDVLEDRCISIVIKRGLSKEITDREVDMQAPEWQALRDELYIFTLQNWKQVKEVYDSLENDTPLKSREWELWKPILALARFFDGDLFERMKVYAIAKAEAKRIEDITETGDMILIETLVNLVQVDDYYKVKLIKDAMAERFEDEQKWLKPEWVGRALKRLLGFVDKRRIGTGVEYKLSRKLVLESAKRLGVGCEGNVGSEPLADKPPKTPPINRTQNDTLPPSATQPTQLTQPSLLTEENLEAVTSCFEKHGKRDDRGLVLGLSSLTAELEKMDRPDPRRLIECLASPEWRKDHTWWLEFTSNLNEIRLVRL